MQNLRNINFLSAQMDKETQPEQPTLPPVGRKFDQGKPRYSLLPPKALREVVKVLTYGSTKYEDFNWMNVENPEDRFFSAGQRHQWDWMDGIILDDENKCHHLASAITNLMFILELELKKAENNSLKGKNAT